jgi:hypothetical protein
MRTSLRIVAASAIALSVAGVGCERTIAEKETVTHKRDGSVKVDRETVKERPDGTRVYEKESGVNRDHDPDIKVDID